MRDMSLGADYAHKLSLDGLGLEGVRSACSIAGDFICRLRERASTGTS